MSDKKSTICEGVRAKETDPPASPELAMAGRYNKLFRFTVPRFKPALVRRIMRFITVLLNTAPRDSMKRTAKPGLGQGLD